MTTASDVYSLGILLHELVCGELPDSLSTDPIVRIRGSLGAIARKALAIDPTERYRSADHMADDLRRHLAGELVSAHTPSWTYRAALFARRNRWPLVLATAVILATVLGWIGSDLDRRRAQSEASIGWGPHAQTKVVVRLFESWIAAVTADDPQLADDAVAHMEQALQGDLARLPEAQTLVRLALAEI